MTAIASVLNVPLSTLVKRAEAQSPTADRSRMSQPQSLIETFRIIFSHTHNDAITWNELHHTTPL